MPICLLVGSGTVMLKIQRQRSARVSFQLVAATQRIAVNRVRHAVARYAVIHCQRPEGRRHGLRVGHGALESDRVVLFPGQRLAMSIRCARVVNNLDRGIRRQAEDRNPAAAPMNDVASKAGIVLLF